MRLLTLRGAGCALALLLVAITSSRADSEPLFSLSAENEPSDGGRTLTATFREIERMPDESVIQLDVQSEGGQSSLLFLARGFCGLLDARKQSIAVVEPLGEKPLKYRAHFLAHLSEAEKSTMGQIVFTTQSCAALIGRSAR